MLDLISAALKDITVYFTILSKFCSSVTNYYHLSFCAVLMSPWLLSIGATHIIILFVSFHIL